MKHLQQLNVSWQCDYNTCSFRYVPRDFTKHISVAEVLSNFFQPHDVVQFDENNSIAIQTSTIVKQCTKGTNVYASFAVMEKAIWM